MDLLLLLLSCEELFNNGFVLIEELSFIFNGNGFNICGAGGNEENFLRSTAIGGNSIPKNAFVDDVSVVLLEEVFVVVDQRSCIFLSRREIFSFSLLAIDSFVSIDKEDDETCSQSLVNPVQMLLLLVVEFFTSIMTLVFVKACSIDDDDDVDDPSIKQNNNNNKQKYYF